MHTCMLTTVDASEDVDTDESNDETVVVESMDSSPSLLIEDIAQEQGNA